jgi:hypothetical protein
MLLSYVLHCYTAFPTLAMVLGETGEGSVGAEASTGVHQAAYTTGAPGTRIPPGNTMQAVKMGHPQGSYAEPSPSNRRLSTCPHGLPVVTGL